jgi:hypothetical protein
MQEMRYDGTDVITERATSADVVRALADKRNREVRAVMPGGIIERWEHNERRRYRVTEDGGLERMTLTGQPWPSDPPKVEELERRVAELEAKTSPHDGLLRRPSADEVEKYR